MTRKTKTAHDELIEATKVVNDAKELFEQNVVKLQETVELLKQAEKEEQDHLVSIKEKIDAILAEENMFAGLRLTTEDISNIVKVAIENKEPISIKYVLYFNE